LVRFRVSVGRLRPGGVAVKSLDSTPAVPLSGNNHGKVVSVAKQYLKVKDGDSLWPGR